MTSCVAIYNILYMCVFSFISAPFFESSLFVLIHLLSRTNTPLSNNNNNNEMQKNGCFATDDIIIYRQRFKISKFVGKLINQRELKSCFYT